MNLDTLRAHIEDAHWGNRLQGFETMLHRLTTTTNTTTSTTAIATISNGNGEEGQVPMVVVPVLPPGLWDNTSLSSHVSHLISSLYIYTDP